MTTPEHWTMRGLDLPEDEQRAMEVRVFVQTHMRVGTRVHHAVVTQHVGTIVAVRAYQYVKGAYGFVVQWDNRVGHDGVYDPDRLEIHHGV